MAQAEGGAQVDGRTQAVAVLMFKAIVLGALYNLSDEALEHEIGDRLTFMRFLGLVDRTPDATTVWPGEAGEGGDRGGVGRTRFFGHGATSGGPRGRFDRPRQGNSKGEDAEIKAGEIPRDGSILTLRRRTGCTKKGGMSYYGYKNHVSTDRRYKLVRRWAVTDASVHDSRVRGDPRPGPRDGVGRQGVPLEGDPGLEHDHAESRGKKLTKP